MKPFSQANYLKIGMIPLLLGILYRVLPSQNSSTTEPATLASEPNRSKRGHEQSLEAKQSVTTTDWPLYQSCELGNVDPFDRRMIFPEIITKPSESDTNSSDGQSLVTTTVSQLATQLNAIKVQAVFQSPRGIAALVGEQVLHIGDRLEDGTEVLEITPEQIVLGPKAIH